MSRAQPCGHCHGTGLCAQTCCTVFGNVAWKQGRRGPERVRICMVCRGTGET